MRVEKLDKTQESIIINSILILRKAVKRRCLKEMPVMNFSELLTELHHALGEAPQLEPKQLKMANEVLMAIYEEISSDARHPLFDKESQVQRVLEVVGVAANSGISIEEAHQKLKESKPDPEEPRAAIVNIFGKKH